MSQERDSRNQLTREDFKTLFHLGRKAVGSLWGVASGAASKVQRELNPNVILIRGLEEKYKALVKAGFNENEAFDLIMQKVGDILKQNVSGNSKKEE